MSQFHNTVIILFFSLFSLTLFNSCSNQQESTQKKRKVTVADVEQGIRDNIAQRVKEGDGYFNFENDSLDLSLKLVRVHTEYLSVLGPNEFFACVDLATTDGDVYDVDFFLKGEVGDMEITKTDIHKLNGKPYYTWKQKKDKTWFTVPVKNASNALLGVIEGTDQFTFTYKVYLPEFKGDANIWIPIAQSDKFQDIEILDIETNIEYQINREAVFGNQYLHANMSESNSSDSISITYKVLRKEKEAYAEEGLNFNQFISANEFVPVGDRFLEIAMETIKEKEANTPLTIARALYDYVVDNVRYAKQGKYGTGDANYACDEKSGNCTEFHSLFISLARSVGIPARFAVGAAIPSERNEGGVNGYHCWAEVFAEGKWWPVDISEANKYTPLATYYFGHHPANRIEFSKGREIRPEPLPASGAISFFAYPVFEVQKKPVDVKTSFSFERIISS